MKIQAVATFLSLSLVVGAKAQNPTTVLDGLVPSGWEVFHRAEGDLNGDGLKDCALILRGTDPKLKVSADALVGWPELDANTGRVKHLLNVNPRRLVIVLGGPTGYRKLCENNGLIEAPNATLADTFEDLYIHKGSLHLNMVYLSRRHGELHARTHYEFVLRENDMELTSAQKTVIDRYVRDVEETREYNFQDGKVFTRLQRFSDLSDLCRETRPFDSKPAEFSTLQAGWQVEKGFWL